MKKIICNLCGETLVAGSVKHGHFKVKITSPFIDVRDVTVHCCTNCYDSMMKAFHQLKEDI